ncbi:MAG: hypothetical protein E6J45_02240 [Chloroflexi bacterium]|nr:MAG: hypothetical protein E6J45_02240 [Chloroflexota bacterium]
MTSPATTGPHMRAPMIQRSSARPPIRRCASRTPTRSSPLSPARPTPGASLRRRRLPLLVICRGLRGRRRARACRARGCTRTPQSMPVPTASGPPAPATTRPTWQPLSVSWISCTAR